MEIRSLEKLKNWVMSENLKKSLMLNLVVSYILNILEKINLISAENFPNARLLCEYGKYRSGSSWVKLK